MIALPEIVGEGVEEAAYVAKLAGDLAVATHPPIVVLDGYHFGTAYQRVIKGAGLKLVCIDDIHAYEFVADVVVNHTGGFTKVDYRLSPETLLFTGLPYVLLRPPFLTAAKKRLPLAKEVSRAFISLGGADNSNNTLLVLEKVKNDDRFSQIDLVLGQSYLHRKSLESYLKSYPNIVHQYSNLSAADMLKLMQASTVAITPPSSTAYEYLCTNGDLYLHLIADNQVRVKEFMLSNRLAFAFEDIDKQPSYQTYANRLIAIDGKQQERFTIIFKNLT